MMMSFPRTTTIRPTAALLVARCSSKSKTVLASSTLLQRPVRIRLNDYQHHCSTRLALRLFSTSQAMEPIINFGDGIKYQKLTTSNDNDEKENATVVKEKKKKKTLVIIGGWLLAKDNQLKPYLNWYHKRGIETLHFPAYPIQIFKPSLCKPHMKRIFDIVIHDINPDEIIYHGFSSGVGMMAQALRMIKDHDNHQDNETNNDIEQQQQSSSSSNIYREKIVNKMKAQIYDSPPDMDKIPVGIAGHVIPDGEISNNPINKMLYHGIKLSLEGYLWIVSNHAGIEYRAASDAFHNNNVITCPSLCFASKADPIANYVDCKKVGDYWIEQGPKLGHYHCQPCVFDNSPHIQHARMYPDIYFNTLEEFLLNAAKIEFITPPKAEAQAQATPEQETQQQQDQPVVE